MNKNLSINKYLDDLASPLPTPGGGSASALAGSLGVSLLCMVSHFSLGDKFKTSQAKTKKILKKLEDIRKKLKLLTYLDIEAYNLVVLARGLDKETKLKAYQESLNVAILISFNCYEALKLALELVEVSNFYLISDLEAAVYLLESAFKSADIFVRVNNDAIKAIRR